MIRRWTILLSLAGGLAALGSVRADEPDGPPPGPGVELAWDEPDDRPPPPGRGPDFDDDRPPPPPGHEFEKGKGKDGKHAKGKRKDHEKEHDKPDHPRKGDHDRDWDKKEKKEGPPRDRLLPHHGPPGPPDGFGPGAMPLPPPGGHPGDRRFVFHAPDDEMMALMREDAMLERETIRIASEIREAKRRIGVPSDPAGKVDPKLAEAKKQVTSAQLEEMNGKLSEIVTKHFEHRQKLRRAQLARMEQQLKKVRDSVELREKERGAIIRRRVGELTGDEDVGF